MNPSYRFIDFAIDKKEEANEWNEKMKKETDPVKKAEYREKRDRAVDLAMQAWRLMPITISKPADDYLRGERADRPSVYEISAWWRRRRKRRDLEAKIIATIFWGGIIIYSIIQLLK